jgi:hypothetical protein
VPPIVALVLASACGAPAATSQPDASPAPLAAAPDSDAHTDAPPAVAPPAAASRAEAPTTVDDSAPVRAACAAYAERASARIAAAFREDHGEIWMHAGDLAAFTRCHPSRRGAWLLVLESLRWLSPRTPADAATPEPAVLRGAYNVGYVRPDGTVARLWRTPRRIDAEQLQAHGAIVLGSSDLDGDGVSEFFFAATYAGHESSDEDRARPVEIATFRDDAVVPYAPLGSVRARSVEDYDADGRLDLRVVSEFEAASDACGGLNPMVYRGASRLVHAREDGSYSDSDRVAAAAMRDACPSAPQRLVARATHESYQALGREDRIDTAETVRRIACARYWDSSPTDVIRRLRAEYPAGAAACLSLAELVRVAQTAPASSLRLR